MFKEGVGTRISSRSRKMANSKVLRSCEHKGKKSKIQLTYLPRELDRFINGFVQHNDAIEIDLLKKIKSFGSKLAELFKNLYFIARNGN